MAKNGYQLSMPPSVARDLLEQYALEAPSRDAMAVIVSPFFRQPAEVKQSIKGMSESGARVVQMRQGRDGCPKLTGRMDAGFQEALTATIVDLITRWSSTARVDGPPILEDPVEYEVACSLLRGLASHDKMGPNNHSHDYSHEDDLWKSRGGNLQPKVRRKIQDRLMESGILARKKNESRGGTGWVYWIADVHRG